MPMTDSTYIIDVTRENYAQLIEASFKVPVLLDFWASWCQPCLALAPILTKLAEEYQGRFLLGKLNTEEEQEIAAQFGIRSIPTVKLFRDGQPVDEFMGALPEPAIREFLDRHVARESDQQVVAARDHLDAGDFDAAEAILGTLPVDELADPQVNLLRDRLFFERGVAETPAATELQARLAADPDDHEARLQLAMRKVVDLDYETAMDLLLEQMKKDRSYAEDAAHQELLKIFELLGDDPRVSRYRRRMASLLF